jgi:hypothetical protein
LGETHRRPCHFGEERKDFVLAGVQTTYRPAITLATIFYKLSQLKVLFILFKHITAHNVLYFCVGFNNNKYLKAETHQLDIQNVRFFQTATLLDFMGIYF